MIQLKIASKIFSYWKNIRVTRSLEKMSGSFDLGLSGELGQVDTYAKSINGGERCQVLLNGIIVIDGYLEKPIISYDETSHNLSVSGRDITADIIDSAAIVDKQELHNVTILDAATALLKNLDIAINCPKPGKPFVKFAINDSDSIFDTLKSHATQRGLLLYTLGDGVLHIGNPVGQITNHQLIEGDNIKAASIERDTSKLYRNYIVKAQGKGGKSTTATATDNNARAGRNLIIHAERNEESSLDLNARAEWEKQSRRAAATRATIKVKGWEAEPGTLWNIGQQIYLDAPRLKITAIQLATAITYSLDEAGGSTTEITLVDPNTYQAKP